MLLKKRRFLFTNKLKQRNSFLYRGSFNSVKGWTRQEKCVSLGAHVCVRATQSSLVVQHSHLLQLQEFWPVGIWKGSKRQQKSVLLRSFSGHKQNQCTAALLHNLFSACCTVFRTSSSAEHIPSSSPSFLYLSCDCCCTSYSLQSSSTWLPLQGLFGTSAFCPPQQLLCLLFTGFAPAIPYHHIPQTAVSRSFDFVLTACFLLEALLV